MHPYQSEAVEVLVLWGERVLSAHTHSRPEALYLGRETGDLHLPSLRGRRPLLHMGTLPRVVVGPGEERVLETGKVLRFPLPEPELSLQIRRIPRPPQAEGEELVDFGAVETAGVLLALAVTLFLAGYMALFGPAPLLRGEAREEKAISKVRILFSPQAAETGLESVPVSVSGSEDRPVVAGTETGKPRPKPSPDRIRSEGSSPQRGSRSQAAPPSRVRPQARTNTLLTAFNSSGLRATLNRMAESSAAVQQMAGNSSGRAGREEGEGRTGLRDTGSGADSRTVGLGSYPGDGRRTGTPGYTGGLSGKSSVRVQTGGGAQETYSGAIDREGIRRVIREHMSEIRSCYERQLQRAPDLYGKVVLQWDIVENGRVANARIQSDELSDSRVAQCLVTRLSAWRFPAPPADQIGRVAYPFVFSSK